MKIPAGARVKAISNCAENERMVDVLWEGRAYVMFILDLNERAHEIPKDSMMPPPVIKSNLDSAKIRQALHQDLRIAHEKRDRASARLNEVMNDIPSGIPSPDGTDRIRQASQQSRDAQKEVMDALTRLNNFLIHGTIPAEMGRKPAFSERPGGKVQKTGRE